MDYMERYKKVPASPTMPGAGAKKAFDAMDLYRGPAGTGLRAAGDGAPYGLDEKLRKAYYWMTNTAVISPFCDIEYADGPSLEYALGDSKARAVFPSGPSYCSFILLPLLNLALRRRCLLVGGPGRGKTTSAVLMALIAGYDMKQIRKSIQHGQPQMTVTDLLGNPLPADLVSAQSFESIRIAWRAWLSMRVKIIDEYNRIPTRTQSALLTVMADNYAEVMDQVYECPEAAWYLTANDDAGGGTYQVIEALRDRIDVVVRALHFNTRFLPSLLERVEAGAKPEELVPPEIIFTQAELDSLNASILALPVPEGIMRRLEFFASQFEFAEAAADQLEYRTKDTIKLSGLAEESLAFMETGKDRLKDLGNQTKNGFSVRALMTSLVFMKAAAFFRGESEVGMEDVRNILPFVMQDKLVPDRNAPFFSQKGNEAYGLDRVSWIRKLFDLSCAEYDALGRDRKDPLRDLLSAFGRGLEGVGRADASAALAEVERLMGEYAQNKKFHGPMFDDVLSLKYLHQRYSAYLRWLDWKA
jgi:MoxR-like ATPase